MTRAVSVCADARRLPLADSSVDLTVTSPPFFRQRRYGATHEIGREATSEAYVAELTAATEEIRRVLKPTGSAFVNLGDKYQNGSLLGLPGLYHAACLRIGLKVRAEIVWRKTSPMPESVTRRVRRAHEVWLHLTGPRDDFYANLDPLRYPHSPVTLARARRGRVTPHAPAGQTPQRRRETVPNPLGALPGSVWDMPAAKALRPPAGLPRHTASFHEEWPRRFIVAWCPPGGVVLDPFGGSGTTAVVAASMGRVGITVDSDPGQCATARWRAGLIAPSAAANPGEGRTDG